MYACRRVLAKREGVGPGAVLLWRGVRQHPAEHGRAEQRELHVDHPIRYIRHDDDDDDDAPIGPRLSLMPAAFRTAKAGALYLWELNNTVRVAAVPGGAPVFTPIFIVPGEHPRLPSILCLVASSARRGPHCPARRRRHPLLQRAL